MMSSTIPVASRISPLISAIAYPLGNQVILPYYFSQIRVMGQENIPKTGPVILAPTHRSRWDALIVAHTTGKTVTGRYLRFMVSADEMRGVQGWFIRRLGGFPVDTHAHHRKLASLDHTVNLLNQGKMVVIFPEGDIFRGSGVQPIKRGVAMVALQAQAEREARECNAPVQIVPVSLQYSQQIPRRGSEVTVKIGEAIAVNQYPQLSMKGASKQLTQDVAAALAALAN
ncbi:MAG: 1-acyl-sn-glycerol-3-phosphate acyltransferase [Spirulina sp. DLM2.Bin59]|nr:MAG: 1-acyl-sn-glycerol-3-phosphate acyltransferase [Spirulina sp. DLM2.Bin59]